MADDKQQPDQSGANFAPNSTRIDPYKNFKFRAAKPEEEAPIKGDKDDPANRKRS